MSASSRVGRTGTCAGAHASGKLQSLPSRCGLPRLSSSASERFGTRRAPKARVASEVAALLAFSAIRNNDRVGLILASDKVNRVVAPKKGEKHVMRVVREILGF